MKKIKDFMKENTVEIGLYGTAAAWILELIVTNTILAEYDKGGSIKTLKNKVLKRD